MNKDARRCPEGIGGDPLNSATRQRERGPAAWGAATRRRGPPPRGGACRSGATTGAQRPRPLRRPANRRQPLPSPLDRPARGAKACTDRRHRNLMDRRRLPCSHRVAPKRAFRGSQSRRRRRCLFFHRGSTPGRCCWQRLPGDNPPEDRQSNPPEDRLGNPSADRHRRRPATRSRRREAKPR